MTIKTKKANETHREIIRQLRILFDEARAEDYSLDLVEDEAVDIISKIFIKYYN